jgi:hypothetical protein
MGDCNGSRGTQGTADGAGGTSGTSRRPAGWAKRSRRWAGALLGALALSAAAQAQTVMLFAEGSGEVTLPDHYQQILDTEASLVVVSTAGNVRLYFDLHKLDMVDRMEKPGEAFVREQAEKKHARLYHIGDTVGLLDPGADTMKNGRAYINLHWQFGFGDTLVLMTAYIPRDARNAADVQQFLSQELEAIVPTFKRLRGSQAGQVPEKTALLR